METKSICDFCSAPAPEWIHEAADFVLDTTWGSTGDWIACATCHDLVQQGSWDDLLARQLAALGTGSCIPDRVRALLDMFRLNATGRVSEMQR